MSPPKKKENACTAGVGGPGANGDSDSGDPPGVRGSHHAALPGAAGRPGGAQRAQHIQDAAQVETDRLHKRRLTEADGRTQIDGMADRPADANVFGLDAPCVIWVRSAKCRIEQSGIGAESDAALYV
jgi:hypothetical protein